MLGAWPEDATSGALTTKLAPSSSAVYGAETGAGAAAVRRNRDDVTRWRDGDVVPSLQSDVARQKCASTNAEPREARGELFEKRSHQTPSQCHAAISVKLQATSSVEESGEVSREPIPKRKLCLDEIEGRDRDRNPCAVRASHAANSAG